jgi:hypothetical protein
MSKEYLKFEIEKLKYKTIDVLIDCVTLLKDEPSREKVCNVVLELEKIINRLNCVKNFLEH